MLSLKVKCKDEMPNCAMTGWGGVAPPKFTLTCGQQDGIGAHGSTGQAPSPSLVWTRRAAGSVPLDLQEFWENQITQRQYYISFCTRGTKDEYKANKRNKSKYSPSAEISDWSLIHICNEKEFWIHNSKFWHWFCRLSYASWRQITACQ